MFLNLSEEHILNWRIQDFPYGGGGRGPPTRVLSGENVCENERIGSRRGSGGVRLKFLYVDPPLSYNHIPKWPQLVFKKYISFKLPRKNLKSDNYDIEFRS